MVMPELYRLNLREFDAKLLPHGASHDTAYTIFQHFIDFRGNVSYFITKSALKVSKE